ncbi:Alpha/Beta hydrolase protein [Aspergillus stella-maris]|uniref:Alpha/Beta hydrolase protein n=1 Tax=Aspergillus stella-maris TaxID=1810926 RepID=UPI003CCD95BB
MAETPSKQELPPPPPPLTTTYKIINGSVITTDIYLPETLPPKGRDVYPVLITLHGGAFMLGQSGLISLPQVAECLRRGWIVVSPNHRLCPGVDVTELMGDVRDLLAWCYGSFECEGVDGRGGLDGFLAEQEKNGKEGRRYRVDRERVMVMGTSSGGFLALAMGYDTPHPPKAILNFYGAVHFTHPSWTQPLPHVQANLPPSGFNPEFLQKVYDEYPVPTTSGISLEGQTNPRKPDFSKPRDAFAMSQIAQGTVLDAIYPASASGGDISTIDPVSRIEKGFPPTFIIHGDSDRMVSVEVSRELFRVLREKGVQSELLEIEGEDHTFALGMKIGSRAWNESLGGFEWLEEIIE